jgi:HAD superfamily hydrolase (TIGR01549 family)
MLKHIKTIIWDFDGTFYPQNPAVTHAMEEGQYQTIMRHTGMTYDQAKEAFWKVYPSQTTSGNAAVGIICKIPTAQAAVENEQGFKRIDFIPKDHTLPTLFAKLKKYRHVILGNGVKKQLEETIAAIGLPADTFEEIVTSEAVGANKPDPAGFVYIMQKTGGKPEEYLMVGDREVVDLVPAKKLGMHTCLVTWGQGFAELPKTGESVDLTINSPYDLPLALDTR